MKALSDLHDPIDVSGAGAHLGPGLDCVGNHPQAARCVQILQPLGQRVDVDHIFVEEVALEVRPCRMEEQDLGIEKFDEDTIAGGASTLHQVVGEPGHARLHVRLGAVGKHIRDAETGVYDVPKRVRDAAK